METEQPLYYCMHVGTITFYLSLTLCGQLGSSNQSALFILSYQELVTYTFMIDPSVFTYDPALSFRVIAVQCHVVSYIVATGTNIYKHQVLYRHNLYIIMLISTPCDKAYILAWVHANANEVRLPHKQSGEAAYPTSTSYI